LEKILLRSSDESETTMRKAEKEVTSTIKKIGLELIQSFDFDNLLYVNAARETNCFFGDSDHVIRVFKRIHFC